MYHMFAQAQASCVGTVLLCMMTGTRMCMQNTRRVL